MARINSINPDQYDAAQQKMFDNITGGDRRARPKNEFLNSEGGIGGPFHPWIHSPALGDPAQNLGAAVRFHGSLDGDVRELAILVVAAHWRAEYEWWAHERIAKAEGLPDNICNALESGSLPSFDATDKKQADYAAAHKFAHELVVDRQVSEQAYDQANQRFGDRGVVDLVTTIGYYTLVSMTLNTFEVPLPAGEKPTFA